MNEYVRRLYKEADQNNTLYFDHVKDSGVREDFDTGSKRDSRAGKGRYDLMSPIVERRLAKHYENGATKYGDRNWEVGMPLMRYLDSAKRHINCWQMGKEDEDHLVAAIWNLAAIVHTEEMIRAGKLDASLDDKVKY